MKTLGPVCAAAFLALGLAGCQGVITMGGADDEGASPVEQGPDGEPQGASNDCDTAAGYELSSYEAASIGSPALRIVGIYESRSDHSYGDHPTGEAAVHVGEPGSVVLVLSSYEPTHWTVTAADGAIVERIVLNGYNTQTVTGPAGVAVDDRSGEGNYLSACAYVWPGDDQGCDTASLVHGVEQLTSLALASFDGCYRMTQFTFTGPEAED